jgi:hypothetical protein
VLGKKAMDYRTMSEYVRSAKCPLKNDVPVAELKTLEPNLVDDVILRVLVHPLFASMFELFRLTCFP